MDMKMPNGKEEEDALLMGGIVQVAAALVAKIFRRAQQKLLPSKETTNVAARSQS